MISTIILTIFFAVAFFSAESLISTIVGGLAAVGVTQWLKGGTGIQGAGLTVLAFVVSFAVAIVALVVSILISGRGFSWEIIPQSAAQIFALATLTYNLLIKDRS